VKGVILSLLALAILALVVSLMTGPATAVEDRYFIYDEPLSDGIVVYAGGDFYFTVDFLNSWANWSVEFHSMIFATSDPEGPREAIAPGDTFTWPDRVRTRAVAGYYDIEMIVNRSVDSVTFDVIETTFILECRYALNVTDFYIRRESFGQWVVIELDLHIPLDRLEVDLHAEGGNFDVVPDVSVATDLPVGPTTLEGEIVLEEARNGPPQIIFYDLVAFSGVHRIEMSHTLDDPEFRREGASIWMWVAIVVIILLGLIIGAVYIRKMKREKDGDTVVEAGREHR
jgi:hypothetical protein